MNFLCVFIGGGLGSLLRYFTGTVFINTKLFGGIIPTLIVNIAASFILGFLMVYFSNKTNISPNLKIMLTTGFCGGLSTFSTFAFESYKIYMTNGLKYAFLYSILSVLLCVFAVFLSVKIMGKII